MNEIVIAAVAGGVASMASVLFALWLRNGILQRIETMEDQMSKKASQERVGLMDEDLKKKMDLSLCKVQHQNLTEKLTSIEDSIGGFITKVETKLDEGTKVMGDLKIQLTGIEQQLKNKGG